MAQIVDVNGYLADLAREVADDKFFGNDVYLNVSELETMRERVLADAAENEGLVSAFYQFVDGLPVLSSDKQTYDLGTVHVYENDSRPTYDTLLSLHADEKTTFVSAHKNQDLTAYPESVAVAPDQVESQVAVEQPEGAEGQSVNQGNAAPSGDASVVEEANPSVVGLADEQQKQFYQALWGMSAQLNPLNTQYYAGGYGAVLQQDRFSAAAGENNVVNVAEVKQMHQFMHEIAGLYGDKQTHDEFVKNYYSFLAGQDRYQSVDGNIVRVNSKVRCLMLKGQL